MKKSIIAPLVLALLFVFISAAGAAAPQTFLIHLKTSLKKDDAQICVAYNMILAALEEGYAVKVLVDGSAINTYKMGWTGKDAIENYKIPETLRRAISRQFAIDPEQVPRTYGEFLGQLKERGAEFYINTGYLMVSKIGVPEEPLKKVSNKFFKPVSLKEMIRLRTGADYYMAY